MSTAYKIFKATDYPQTIECEMPNCLGTASFDTPVAGIGIWMYLCEPHFTSHGNLGLATNITNKLIRLKIEKVKNR